jgi:predicted Zn-dependent protease
LVSYIDKLPYSGNNPFDFKFIVIEEPIVNAHAEIGANISVYSGLIDVCFRDGELNYDALSFVISHEIGHALCRHPVEGAVIANARKATISWLKGCSAPSPVRAGGGIFSGSTELAELKFSRHDENEADEIGYRLMNLAGYNTNGAYYMMNIFKSMTPTKILNWYGTHPLPENRIERLKVIEAETSIPNYSFSLTPNLNTYENSTPNLIGTWFDENSQFTLYDNGILELKFDADGKTQKGYWKRSSDYLYFYIHNLTYEYKIINFKNDK